MKKINLWLICQNKKWKWLIVNGNHPCGDLAKCIDECLYEEAKKREKAKLGYDSAFDLVALFADAVLTHDERTIMMECVSAIDERLQKEKGLKLASVSCVNGCDWVRWFTAKDVKQWFKALEKSQKKKGKRHEERDG